MNTVSACPACKKEHSSLVFNGYGFDDSCEVFPVVECADCHLVHVEPLLTPAQLGPYYSMAYYGTSGKKFTGPMERLVKWANRARAVKLANFVRPTQKQEPAKVLDIGCGRANFLKAMSQMGFSAWGTEIPGFSFPDDAPGVSFVHSYGDQIPFESGSFDAVSIWHVLEHVGDPAECLTRIAKVLKPGGVAVVAVPHYGSFQARLFGRHWFHLDLPRHLFHFSRRSLVSMLEQRGLKVVDVGTSSLDQNLFGFVQSFMNVFFYRSNPNGFYSVLKKKQAGKSAMSRGLSLLGYGLFAAILMPFAIIENFVSSLFGMGGSLIVYARKEVTPH